MDPVPQTCAPTTQPGGVQRDPAVGVVDRDARTAPTPRNTVPVPVSAGTLSLEHDRAVAVGFALQGGAGGQSSSTGEQRWCRGVLLKHAITHGQERVFLRGKIWMSVSKPSKDASVSGGECSGGRTWGLGPATSCWCPRGGGTEQLVSQLKNVRLLRFTVIVLQPRGRRCVSSWMRNHPPPPQTFSRT